MSWPPTVGDVDAVAVALPGAATLAVARAAVSAGRPVAAVADEEVAIAALLGPRRRGAGRGQLRWSSGCALVPGLGDVLARHAANALDAADEVHVARVGAAGPECVAALAPDRGVSVRSSGTTAAWRSERRLGPQLVWFPDPVGAWECECVAVGRRAHARRSARCAPRVGSSRGAAGAQRRRGVPRPPAARRRVGRRARRGVGLARRRREAIVYGVIERPAVAAGTVLAVTAARLAGLLPIGHCAPNPRRGRPRHARDAGAVPRRARAARREGGRVRRRRGSPDRTRQPIQGTNAWRLRSRRRRGRSSAG